MAHQIVYTSVPRGLAPGSKGYCTVVASNGMAPVLQRQLESLSQYNHIHPPNTANDVLNPTNFQYSKASFGGKQLCVLSRVSDAGLDYSRRSNLLAHHVALELDECNMAGPAALIESLILPPSVKKWEKPPQRLDLGAIPNPSCPTSPMNSHNSVGIKPEVVGELAGRLANSSQRIVTVLYRPEQHPHLLSLVTDLFWLMPPRDRWNTTFSTYYSADVQNTDCRLRFIPHGTPNAERVMLEPGTIDLNQNMTVLDSEFVQAAKEAAKTGNRTLAHPRVEGPAHSTGESFTRAQRHASTPRPPIGGPELHLQPPPIAQPATQPHSNQDRHKTREKTLLENQDRHSSGARKKLVIAISAVAAFLLFGIITVVVLNNTESGPDDSIAQSGSDSTGNRVKQPTQGNSGHDLTTNGNENQGNSNSGDANQDRHNTGGSTDGDGNQDRHNMSDEEGHGSKGNDENVNNTSETPLTTGITTEYKVDLKRKKIMYVDDQKLISSERFPINDVYDDAKKFSPIQEKRISLLQSQATELQVSQSDERVNQITLGLNSEGDKELLDIELTDEPEDQLIFSWREEIDPARKSDLKKKLSTELIKTVLLVPYFLEKTSELHQKVRMRVVTFGYMNDSPINKTAFPENGYYNLSQEDSSELVRAVDSVNTSDDSTIKVTANLPRYNAQDGHIQVNKILNVNEKKTEFTSQSFWQNGVEISDYTPEISFFLNMSTENEVRYGFNVNEIEYQGPNDKAPSFEVFKYLNSISNSDKDKYLWDPKKHEPKVIPKDANAKVRADINKENDERGRNADSFHQTFAIKIGREFLTVQPTCSYIVKTAKTSPEKLNLWINGAVNFGERMGNKETLKDGPLERLQMAKKINERIFAHLPDVNKLVMERAAYKAILIEKIQTQTQVQMFTNGLSEQPFDFDEKFKDDLDDYRKFCQRRLDEKAEEKKLKPMKLEQITNDLTNWASTLHGLFRINQKLTNKQAPIQIQIEVLQTFKLPSTYGTDDNISMPDNFTSEGKNSDDLIVPIVRLGQVEAINN